MKHMSEVSVTKAQVQASPIEKTMNLCYNSVILTDPCIIISLYTITTLLSTCLRILMNRYRRLYSQCQFPSIPYVKYSRFNHNTSSFINLFWSGSIILDVLFKFILIINNLCTFNAVGTKWLSCYLKLPPPQGNCKQITSNLRGYMVWYKYTKYFL